MSTMAKKSWRRSRTDDGAATNPKIYHIVHVDRLPSIISDGFLWCDKEIVERLPANPRLGTMIGIHGVKRRRLTDLKLTNHPDL